MNAQLEQLFHYCKTDWKAYEEDIQAQLQLLHSLLQLVNSASHSEQLSSLLIFVASIANKVPHFPMMQQIYESITDILQRHGQVLEPELRFQLVRTLAILGKSRAQDVCNTLNTYFPLFRCMDKQLRKYIFQLIFNTVERAIEKGPKLSFQCKSLIYQYLQDNHEKIAQKTLLLLIRLYAKGILSDASTCNVMSSCCFHENTKTKAIAIHFFLQERFQDDEDSDTSSNDSEEEDEDNNNNHQLQAVISQKTKELKNTYKMTSKKNARKKRQLERKILRIYNSERRRRKRKHELDPKVEPPVSLLFRPEEFAERLFAELKKKNQRFQLRLSIIQLIAKVVGFHRLDIPSFIQYLLGYLRPQQEGVTKMLVVLLQAIHDCTPMETVEMVIRYIADHFVIPQMSANTCAVGLNSIRILCEKQPNAIDSALLEDLIQYKTSKDKSVMMAARSILSVYRKLCPNLLPKSERGKLGNIRALEEKRAQISSESLSSSPLSFDVSSEEEIEIDSEEESLDSSVEEEIEQDDSNPSELPEDCSTIIEENSFHSISIKDIECYHKTRRSKEERIAAVKRGRIDRPKYGKGAKQKCKTGPTTNRAKQKLQVAGIVQQRRRKQYMQSWKQRNTKKRRK